MAARPRPAPVSDDPLTEIRVMFTEMRGDHELLRQRIGEPSQDGKAGTGLIGDVAELKQQMRGMLGLKNRGVGFLAAIGLLAVVLILGIKGTVAAAASGVASFFSGT